MVERIKSRYISELKARIALSIFVIYTFVLFSAYNLLIEVFTVVRGKNRPTTFATAVVVAVFAIVLFVMIKRMKYPLSFFGFNLKHWKRHLVESLVLTVVFCLCLTGFKWVLIHYVSLYSGLTLFYSNSQYAQSVWIAAAMIYAIFAVVQAFIIQGAIQSSLMKLIKVPYATISSVVISSLVFGALHVDLNLVYAVAVIVPGIFWASMYARQRSLLGVSLSHVIIGLWAFWGLGMQQVFRIFWEYLSQNF